MTTETTRLAGVMGWPIGHSRSPQLHGHWLRRYGIDGAYLPLAVSPDRLEAALRGLPALGFRGCNVTIPHKEAVAGLVDTMDPAARWIGAVNTVTVAPDGTLAGSNTDGFGFLENLKQWAAHWRADTGPALVIGAGGAARGILAALLDDGAKRIRLANRTEERARDLAQSLDSQRIEPVRWEERTDAMVDVTLLVNTTSQGMEGQPSLDLPLAALPDKALVTDLVYTPLMTPLLAAAAERGNPIVDGVGMLLHQARPGFAAWFGVDPVVDTALRQAVLGD